jgi:uncharacterized protein (TIGR00661 family)
MSASHQKPVLFFGVNSEGMGHATRALPLIQGLMQFYEVHVFCGGRAHAFLSRHLPHVHDVWYLRLIYENNRFLLGPTVLGALKTVHRCVGSVLWLAGMILKHEPVAIVTDYEATTAWAALLTGRKVISIDNQHVITFGDFPEPLDEAGRRARRVMRNSNFWNHPVRHRVLITHFFQPPLKAGAEERGVRYVPTTARPQVLERMGRTRSDGPVLVYQTSSTNQDLLGTLKEARRATGLSFAVYGTHPPAGAQVPEGVIFKPFCEEGFFDDMAAAPFIIVNGGHSTINEALALHKPVLAEPIADQYEQATNVIGLESMGLGRGTTKLSVEDITAFHRELPRMARNAAQLNRVDTLGVVHAVVDALWELNPEGAVNPAHVRGLTTVPAQPAAAWSSPLRAA